MLIWAKPLAAIHWLVGIHQALHGPHLSTSPLCSPVPHPGSSMGLMGVLQGQVTGGTGMLTVFRPRSLQTGRTPANGAQSRLHL